MSERKEIKEKNEDHKLKIPKFEKEKKKCGLDERGEKRKWVWIAKEKKRNERLY